MADFVELDFLDAVVVGFAEEELGVGFGEGVGFDRFVVEVPVGEGAACGAEGGEVCGEGDAGEHFFEVGGEAGFVFGAVEDAVDVIKDVFFGEGGGVVVGLEFVEDAVGDVVFAGVAAGVGLGGEECAEFAGFFVGIEGEGLSFFNNFQIR